MPPTLVYVIGDEKFLVPAADADLLERLLDCFRGRGERVPFAHKLPLVGLPRLLIKALMSASVLIESKETSPPLMVAVSL